MTTAGNPPTVIVGLAAASAVAWLLAATGKILDPAPAYAAAAAIGLDAWAEPSVRALVFVEALTAGACALRPARLRVHAAGLSLIGALFLVRQLSMPTAMDTACGCGLEAWFGPEVPPWLTPGVLTGLHGLAIASIVLCDRSGDSRSTEALTGTATRQSPSWAPRHLKEEL